DHGPDVPGGPPGTPDQDGDRYVEIWNLVFMQYDRATDGSMTPLPAPSVDTGMGLERLAAVLQGVHSNYDIDLFKHLITAAAKVTGASEIGSNSLKVIADHIRACAFLIVDGVLPSNEGRGYVLRRIIRRAIRHGHQLGCNGLFFSRMVAPLVDVMGSAWPELAAAQQQIVDVLAREEKRFGETLDQGMRLLEEAIGKLSGKQIPGEVVFRLYDTYGFPVDLTRDIARERGLTLDEAGFEAAMEAQRERARAAGHFGGADIMPAGLAAEIEPTQFLGHEHGTVNDARVLAILVNGQPAGAIEAGQDAVLIVDRTPFYAESGGQVGDTGVFENDGARFEVSDTRFLGGAFHGHFGRLDSGTLKSGERVSGSIDAGRRADIVRHHSATHLLHSALREVLGSHVQQKGSLVAPDRLRFDFSHPQPVTQDELAAIEKLVNDQIQANTPAEIREMAFDQAIKEGALAFFDEKYGDAVRVLRFGDFSMELCGGTHVERVGDIGLFKITSESGVSAGVRRIEAVAGKLAIDWLQALENTVRRASVRLKTSPEKLTERVDQLIERSRSLEKELERLKGQLASAAGSDLVSQAVDINGVRLIAAQLDGADANSLRDTVDLLRNKLGSGVIVLGTVADSGVRLVAGVSKDLTGILRAGDVVNHVAAQVGGRGGGRPDFAQAGGHDAKALPAALASVESWLRQQLEQA
ncbi:MAG TPA: alanine--tRNA ligase, partial [Wenzhouxiangella sp.]|nr:alanine--tRNA ligase [Wenzhouxiangella sp.]